MYISPFAGCVLRRIASLPHSRVVVGTRPSTLGDAERAAHPNENLLDTLGRSTSVVIVHVEPDFDAVASKIRRDMGRFASPELIENALKQIQSKM